MEVFPVFAGPYVICVVARLNVLPLSLNDVAARLNILSKESLNLVSLYFCLSGDMCVSVLSALIVII